MDADESFLATSGQDERSSWPLDLNLPLCPTATKETPLPPPNPSPELSSSASSSVSAAGGGCQDVSPTSSLLQPPVTPSSPHPNFLPKLSSPVQPNYKEENEDRGEALVGHVLFSSDGTVYLLKGEEEEEGALPSPASPRDSPKSTLSSHPPLTSFRLTATYQGFRSNQISLHTSAEAAELTQPAPGNSPRKQDQPKEKEIEGHKGEDDFSHKSTGETIRTQRVDGTWICHPCQLNFRSGKQLGLHASHFHGLDHPYQDELASGDTSGIIHRSSGQVFLSLLEPKKSHIVLDAGQEPENVALSDVQDTPLLDVIQSATEQSGTLEDVVKDTKHDTKSHVAFQGKPESPKLSMGLVPNSPLSYHKCESTGTSHSTEAKDSKANKDEKNSAENWCSAGTEALGEDVEGEVEDMLESNPSAAQTSDINEQLLANQSFYGPMMTNSLLQMGALHGSDKGGNQTDADRGPLVFDECTPSSGPQSFQSMSLQGQLSLLHSRNSCKTLKCPKCNWHYKYQQTLDVHMKEKHPESHSHCSYCHSGQQHPRLARGESYNCGYKPYRCEACNYSTTTKGNLTIHMQSDKHLANLQGYQGSGPAANTSLPPVAAPTVNTGQGEGSQTSPTDRQLKQKASWHCKVCNYETNISRNLRIHMTSEKHMQNVLLLHQGLGMGQDNFPFYGTPLAPEQGLEHPLLFNPMHFSSAGTQACNLLTPDHQPNSQVNTVNPSGMAIPPPPSLPESSPSPDEELLPGVFRCLVCRCFTTDSLEGLLSHASRGRSLPEREWREVRGDLHCCRLCSYSTQLKANFQLHLKTDKHAQKYQLAAHMREGGAALATAQASAAELPISGYSQASSFPPLHLRCNLCGYESNSREKIQLHVQGGGHEESLRVYKFLQAIEGIGGSDVCFRCAPCDSTTGSRLGMMSHLRSTSHHQNLTQWRLMNGEAVLERIVTVCRSQQEPSKVPMNPEIPSNPDPGGENTNTAQASVQEETSRAECEKAAEGTTVFCCPFCAYVSPSEEQVHSHAVSQHALQPTFRCPLCQEQLTGTGNLRGHLGHGHNVVSECVEKLLQVAQKVNITFRTRIIPVRIIEEPDQPVTENTPSSEVECSPPESPGDISTNPAEAADIVTDSEKAQDETSCPLCPVTSENSQDLRTHLEKDHPELSQSEIQQACESRGREVDTVEQEDRKGSQENTPAQPQQSTYRKTANFAMDKFMDPSRPHKCVVCKESFTQKNILLVHYNSVSHLHKVRKASLDPSLSTRNESGVGTTGHGVQTGQDKPYKCTVCHVSYNQSSTLEIHMRSVLHQTRSRSSKQDPSKTSSEKPQRDSGIKSETITDTRGETADTQGIDVTKKRQQQLGPCMGVPLLPTTVAPPPMPLSMDLSRPPPLVQPSPLFAPSLLPSFPLIPETLLKLQRQQQQLLLPFYLQELKVNGDGNSAPLLPFGGAQQPPPVKDEGDQPSATPRQASEKDEKVPDERDAATGETSASQNPDSSSKVSGDPTGSAARALLEKFGFELVTQYNEGRQPVTSQAQPQPRPPAPPLDTLTTASSTEKLQCGTCGKIFSNRLILKTHEEHMHQRLLPFEALSRYAANFRRSYDSHNPSGANSDIPVTPLDFSVTSQHSHASKELEQQEVILEHGVTIEQLSFLQSLFDFPGPLLEEQIMWVSDKTGLSPATIRHWYKQKENILQENQDEETDESSRLDRLGHRRFSRTKFSEFQTQALNSFFESSAYPRDSEVEQLSELLGLSGRVVVVWFQNARQKARKHAAESGTSPSPPLHLGQPGERPVANSKIPPCRKCGITLPCIFQLIRHLKICYYDHTEETTEVQEKEEECDKTKTKPEPLPDPIDHQEKAIKSEQEKQENEQSNNSEEQEPVAPVTKGNIDSPKVSEENIQQPDQIDQPAEQNEPSNLTNSADQNQSKSILGSTHLSAPLMDLSLLIPVGSGDVTCQRKRKHEEESLSPTGSEGGDEPPRDKRLRTTILPEQLDILHRWYLQDSNPTRSTLERISLEVGLKKRVVQVWFQNTRARERKGQYRGGVPSSVSGPKQQDDTPNEASKREAVNYYYSASSNQLVPQLPAKSSSSTVQATCSSILPKPPASCSGTITSVTKPLVNPTQALSGLLSATQVLPSLVNPSQALTNLTNSQALPGLVNPPQALSGLVNPNQTFTGLVNPAQVLSSLVSTSQPSQGLLLASFTAKPAPPILLSSAAEVKLHSSASQQVSAQTSGGQASEPEKTSTPPFPDTTDSSKVINSEQQTTENQTVENQGTNSQKCLDEKGATKNMESLMHSPQGGDISDSSSSDPGPSSPGKGAYNSEGLLGSSGARRYRTQMSSLQLRILKACYAEYRTPSMQECDCLGGQIGLQKRVVQVWFQNARAKEKKAKLQGLVGTTSTNEGPQPTECTHCNVKYGPTIPCRAHIFSRQHIARLRVSIQQQLKEESRYRDAHPSGGAASVPESKPASQILNFQSPATMTPQIQRLTPLLMPGQGIPAPISGLATFNTGPPPSLIGMTSSVPPALLPRAAPSAPTSSHTTSDTTKDSSQPALTPETTGPSALKAAPLMGAPFMPFSLAPAATPLFTPQIQGPYFQQLYGLKKRLFPINPVIPHTLLGLLPAPLKLAPETSSSRKPEPSQMKATSESGGNQEPTVGDEESVERDEELEDEDIPMVDVAIRYQCQRCKTSYDEEGEAEAHQRAGCYTTPPPHPPPLRVRVCTYHCLSCQVLLQGPAARSQHLRSQQHRAQSACSDGASSAIPQLRPKSAATSVLMAL
ncbi:zinc finger homeobox protein 2 [Hyla sarda]|uniref:zinc finger homeobox protein 2 n=1 Tax=Hyla sarda TaxID=327740 RepID=UPI0024C3BEE1|nr:zinc finger homeobox protein 2 [Hyla sarda]XP_056382411.1 zinc finger homeobox protein 2 [Hyla sarda]